MSRWPLVFWGLVMLALAGLFGYRLYQQSREAATPTRRESARSEPPPGLMVPEFRLTERSGQEFTSSSLAGQVWVASFFFTKCPGACLRLNSAIAEIRQELGAAPVTFVSITVDPETDTPEILRKYADHYGADPQGWLFLTGTLPQIKQLAEQSFQVSVERVTHSDRLILIDRTGRVRGTYRGTDPQEVTRFKQRLGELVEDAT